MDTRGFRQSENVDDRRENSRIMEHIRTMYDFAQNPSLAGEIWNEPHIPRSSLPWPEGDPTSELARALGIDQVAPEYLTMNMPLMNMPLRSK